MRTLVSSTWRFSEDDVTVEAGVSYASGRYAVKPIGKSAFEFMDQRPPSSMTRKVAKLIERAAEFCEGELKDPGTKKAESEQSTWEADKCVMCGKPVEEPAGDIPLCPGPGSGCYARYSAGMPPDAEYAKLVAARDALKDRAQSADEKKEAWMDETAAKFRKAYGGRGADKAANLEAWLDEAARDKLEEHDARTASIEDTAHLKDKPASEHPQELKGPDGETLVKVAEIKGGKWRGPANTDNVVADAKPNRHFGQGTEDSRGPEIDRVMGPAPAPIDPASPEACRASTEALRGVKVDLRNERPAYPKTTPLKNEEGFSVSEEQVRLNLLKEAEELKRKSEEKMAKALYSIPGAPRNCVGGVEWAQDLGAALIAKKKAERDALTRENDEARSKLAQLNEMIRKTREERAP